MTLEVGLVAGSLVIVLGTAGCVVILSSMLCATTFGRFSRLAPATRANLLLAWAALPPLAGCLLLVFILMPSIAHVLGLGMDHCHAHGHNAHLCLVQAAFVTGGTLEQLGLAVEQTCDEVAARHSGGRLQMAETILKLTRLAGASRSSPISVVPSFTGSDAALRVEALLRPALPLRPWLGAAAYVLIGCLIVVGLVISDWWHHRAESLFGFYLG